VCVVLFTNTSAGKSCSIRF